VIVFPSTPSVPVLRRFVSPAPVVRFGFWLLLFRVHVLAAAFLLLYMLLLPPASVVVFAGVGSCSRRSFFSGDVLFAGYSDRVVQIRFWVGFGVGGSGVG
jgi:hypothetical protein